LVVNDVILTSLYSHEVFHWLLCSLLPPALYGHGIVRFTNPISSKSGSQDMVLSSPLQRSSTNTSYYSLMTSFYSHAFRQAINSHHFRVTLHFISQFALKESIDNA